MQEDVKAAFSATYVRLTLDQMEAEELTDTSTAFYGSGTMDEFYSDERYFSLGKFQIARVNHWMWHSALTSAKHTQALCELDPHDEVLIARMTAIERLDEMKCSRPGRVSAINTPAIRASLERRTAVRADLANQSKA